MTDEDGYAHEAPFEQGLVLARSVMATADITLSDEHLEAIGAAILCGFAAAGGLSYRSRQSLKRAADRWAALGDKE